MEQKIIKFNNKKELINHIKRLFNKYEIEIKGINKNKKSLKNFEDIDINVYGLKKTPYYELVFINNKLILITIYFFKSKKLISSKKDTYNQEQKIKRECQLVIDFMFKYLRKKDKKYLKHIQKRIK